MKIVTPVAFEWRQTLTETPEIVYLFLYCLQGDNVEKTEKDRQGTGVCRLDLPEVATDT